MEPQNIMQTWINLLTDAARGNEKARDTVRTFTGMPMPMRPDELLRLTMQFAPTGVMPQGELMNEWLEEYWKSIGVVPRYRYLELLDRYEQLRQRVEEMERTNRRLEPMMNAAAQSEEAKKVFGTWSSMIEETMKAQQEILRSWTRPASTEQAAPEAEPTQDAPTPKETPASSARPKAARSGADKSADAAGKKSDGS